MFSALENGSFGRVKVAWSLELELELQPFPRSAAKGPG